MWTNKTTTAGICMIQLSISENSRRNSIEGTETKNLSCNIMDRCQTLLDMGYTVGEHGRRRYDTHWFDPGKVTCSVVLQKINYTYPGFY